MTVRLLLLVHDRVMAEVPLKGVWRRPFETAEKDPEPISSLSVCEAEAGWGKEMMEECTVAYGAGVDGAGSANQICGQGEW